MYIPNPHHTRARKIRKNRAGVYVTHEARRMRRRERYRATVARTREYGKDFLWGTLFFAGLWALVSVLVLGGLLVFG
jgi:hypothetical protein